MADSYVASGFFPGLENGNSHYRCETSWCGEHATGITTTPKETHEAFFLSSLACDCLEQIKKADTGKPFSMQIHFWGPHQPFFPTKEYADLYDSGSIGEYPSYSDTLEGRPDVFRMEASRPLSADGKNIVVPSVYHWTVWQKILARCYGHISMIDAAGGMIIDKLRELGLDEDALIVWTTDHGDAIATHGGHFDKDSHMSEEVMRVPLAMNWKGRIPAGRKDSHLVYTCDIPVTIADAAELSFSNKVDGASLLSLAEGKTTDWRNDLMCESYGHGYGTTIIGRMLLAPPYKLVMTEDDLMQLYDLSSDPFEMHNLAYDERFSAVLDDMQERLKTHMEKSSDPVPFQELKRRVRSEKKN
jgi:Arylsulfatase A and related enzymes